MPNEISNQTPTMSSREIAELVESRHDKVKQSIERLAERGVIVRPPMGAEHFADAMGRPRSESVFYLGKRDSYVVVAQLSPEFTARLVDRWQELEAAVAPLAPVHALPQSFADALQLAADQARQIEKQQSEIAALEPRADAYDRFMDAPGVFGLQAAGRALGCYPNKFIRWLREKYIWDSSEGLVGRSQYVTAGLFETRPVPTRSSHAKVQAFITPKGIDYFSTRIPQHLRIPKQTSVPALPAAATAH